MSQVYSITAAIEMNLCKLLVSPEFKDLKESLQVAFL